MIEIVMKQNTEHWENILEVVKKKLRDRDYNTWIEDRLSFVSCDKSNGVLCLRVDSDFQMAQIELKYASVIESAASEVYGLPLRIRFLLPGEEASIKTHSFQADDKEIIFDPRYTFNNFIVGDNSRFAAGAAEAVAQAPGKAYSPLFIYGGSGLGKTHLINAIGIYILENFPKLKVLFVSSETFTDDFVNATIHKKMNDFKKKYRNVDVLLIDDIQFISEKEKTIEEVFNTYNTLYQTGKQMVFTSDKPPNDLLGIDERLRGRLAAGLAVDITPPSYEIKVAILKKKAYLDGVAKEGEELEEGLSEVISFIAEIIKTNVRELESAFNRVVAYAKFVGVPFTKALAKQVLSDIVKSSEKGPSVKDIKKVVANYFNISISAIDSDERTRSFSMPRQIAMYLCREIAGISFPKIAEGFKKDAATVQYGYNKIKKEIKQNDYLNNAVNELTEKIQTEY